jgi:basic membrane protein A
MASRASGDVELSPIIAATFVPKQFDSPAADTSHCVAPFHNFESLVSPDLSGELDTIKAGIIDGSIPVASYLG